MRITTIIASAVLAGITLPAVGQEKCAIPAPESQVKLIHKTGAGALYENACGQRYETGYLLKGVGLYLAGGGYHSLDGVTPENAQKMLRKTYGLVGKAPNVIRTKW